MNNISVELWCITGGQGDDELSVVLSRRTES